MMNSRTCLVALSVGLTIVACGGAGDQADAGGSGGGESGGGESGGGESGGSASGGSESGGSASGGSESGGDGSGGAADGGSPASGGSDSGGGGLGSGGDGGASTGATSGSGGAAGEGGDPGSGGEANVPSDAPIKIVVLGASSAAGKNLDEPIYGGEVGGLVDSWVNRLAVHLDAARPGSSVINLAKPGYNTYHALPTGTVNPPGAPDVDPARNITAALAEDPDALIISFPGAGEVEVGDDETDIVANHRLIVDIAQDSGVPSWVATTQPHVTQTAAETTFGLAYRQAVLDEFGSSALDFWTPLALPDDSGADSSLLLTDGVHPNKFGHQALYEVVLLADIPSVALAP